MTSKSKNKGNRLEREIRDLLNKAYNTEEFARTPGSGAIMGLSNYEKNQNLEDSTKRALGSDIICPTWFKFSIECKNYNDKPNLAKLIIDNDTDLDGWIGESLFDAINSGRTPLLIFRTSRKGTFCVLPSLFGHLISNQNINYLKYHDFFIINSKEFFNLSKIFHEWNELKFSDIQEWLKTDCVQVLISKMLTKKGKKEKVSE